MKSTLKILSVILLCWFAIHTIVIVIDGLNDERVKSDVAVILGNKVNEDGSLSLRLRKRLDKGIELFNDSLVNVLVVSGGLGKEGFYEGTKMAEYLVSKGIPKEKIITDNAGKTTRATAENFCRMNLKVESVIVISQYYHITRTKLAFRNEGIENVSGVHCDYYEWRDFYSIIREFFGYYMYLLEK